MKKKFLGGSVSVRNKIVRGKSYCYMRWRNNAREVSLNDEDLQIIADMQDRAISLHSLLSRFLSGEYLPSAACQDLLHLGIDVTQIYQKIYDSSSATVIDDVRLCRFSSSPD